MKKILYILLISFILIGTEQLAEHFIRNNERFVSEWTSEYLMVLNEKKWG